MNNSLQKPPMNDKFFFVSPSTGKLEEILYQFSRIRDGNHKSLEDYIINLKNQEQDLLKRLEEYKKQQIALLQKQKDCEIQNANDEFEDFVFSLNEMKK
jgi:hypothetical protein